MTITDTLPADIDTITFCLEAGYSAPVTAAMLALVEDPSDDDLLRSALEAFSVGKYVDYAVRSDFISAVEELTDWVCCFCDQCDRVVWQDDTTSVEGSRVCDDSCLHECSTCDSCENWFFETYSVSGRTYCDSCRDRYAHYCERCEEHYIDGDEDHDHDNCQCEAPRPRFKFPANGQGSVAQNERLTIELPQGTIDNEGIKAIQQLLWNSLGAQAYLAVEVIDSVGPIWQTKQGNFTRRLSNAAYKKHRIKLEPGVISEIGNLARTHSSNTATWHIEFTRDLNDSAEAFCHEGSCWWGSHSESRCCLKSWGGLGLRTFTDGDDYAEPSGRAWVQPLNSDLQPTHDAFGAHAYVVYNAYEDLSNFVAARIVGHLSSRTYRRISLEADGQYINNNSGVLVADEATCNTTESLYFSYSTHDQRDAHSTNWTLTEVTA